MVINHSGWHGAIRISGTAGMLRCGWPGLTAGSPSYIGSELAQSRGSLCSSMLVDRSADDVSSRKHLSDPKRSYWG